MQQLLSSIAKTRYLRNLLAASILVTILFPIANHLVVHPQYSKFLLQNTEEEAVRTARHLTLQLIPKSTGLTRDSIPESMITSADDIKLSLGLMKFKIFSKTGETLFSTDSKDIGVVNKNDYFFDIVSQGNAYTKLIHKDTETMEQEVSSQDVVETYVPVLLDNTFIGAFEIYFDITDRLEVLDRLQFLSALILVAVASTLSLVVVWAIRGAAIAMQRTDTAKEELRKLNRQLEDRVEERTRELSFEKDRADFANQSKSEFLANMSHELRTPLNSVIAYSEVLMKETFGPVGSKKNEEYIADIHQSGSLLLELIGDILDISKIEAGEMNLIEEEADIIAIANAMVSMVAVRAKAKNLNLYLDTPYTHLFAYVDDRQIKQIILNLLSNAIKFTEDEGTVTFKITITTSKHLKFVIEDTGIGIAREDLLHVTEPFNQVASSQTKTKGGTGLGLAIVKSLVNNHGGELILSSELGVGTKIEILFPPARVGSTILATKSA